MFLIIVFLSACGKSGSSTTTPPPAAAAGNVSIANFAFVPSTLTVKPGEVITWKNNDGVAHTVTSNDGSTFNSGNLAAGASFSFTAITPGTYSYHCSIHSNMTATITVAQ